MMFVGTLVGVVAALGLQIIGGRALGADRFAPVSVMWALLFIGVTVFLLPVEQMVIRRLVLLRGHPSPLRGAMPAVLTVVIGSALGAGLFALLASDALLGGDLGYILVGVAMLLGHGLFVVARGHLAAAHRYFTYGLLVALDGLTKLAGSVIVVALGLGPLAFTWALALSPLVVLVVRPFKREVPSDAGAVHEPGSERRFMAGFLVSTAASQTVLAAGPWVVGLLGATPAAISIFFVTTTLFRGPLSASYNLLARILPAITYRAASGQHEMLARWSWRMLIGGALGAVAAFVAAWFVGPPIVEILFGAEFRPEAWLTALAAAAVIAGIAGLAITQILVGHGATGRMALAWLIALGAAATAVVVSPGEPSFRVAVGFVVGEIAALVGLHVAVVGRRLAAAG